MSNPKIELGSLDFDEIKASLKSFLGGQEEFKDFSFDGSAIGTLVDLLAYNSFYYAFYNNMFANEMFIDTAQRPDSLISLAKPMGYVVPGRISSSVSLKLRVAGEAGASVAAFQPIQATNANGQTTTFFNAKEFTLQNIPGTEEPIAIFDAYQATEAVIEQIFETEPEQQRVFLPSSDIDIRTIKVEVDVEGTGTFVEYRRSGTFAPNIFEDDTVYFLERERNGFYVNFSGRYDPSTGIVIGSGLNPNSIVRVSYLVSGGQIGNNYGFFAYKNTPNSIDGGTQISLNSGTQLVPQTGNSSGGKDDPDPDNLRFFIPKTFAAQDRAVTKNDCLALLNEAGFGQGEGDPNKFISVFGGDELSPPVLGRLFVSLVDGNENAIDPSSPTAEEAIKILREKTVVTVIPEYKKAEFIDANVDLIVRRDKSIAIKSDEQIISEINQSFNKITNKKFNYSLDTIALAQDIESIDPGIVPIVNPDKTDLAYPFFICRFKVSSSTSSIREKTFYFGNKLAVFYMLAGDDSFSSPLSSVPCRLSQGQQIPGIPTRRFSLRLVEDESNAVVEDVGIGYVDLDTGIVKINSGVTRGPFTLSANPFDITSVSGVRQVIVSPIANSVRLADS